MDLEVVIEGITDAHLEPSCRHFASFINGVDRSGCAVQHMRVWSRTIQSTSE
jgi:hypothetical protein